MTVTQMNIDTAPRELEALTKTGRYNLRTVATQLGLMEGEKAKQAFMSLSQEEQAKAVLAALLEKDGGGKKAASNGAAVRQPSNKGAKATTTKAATSDAAVASAGDVGAAQVIALLSGIKESLDSLAERLESVEGSVEGLESHVAGTNKLVSVALSLNLTLAENILGAPPAAVLQTSIDDVAGIEPALRAFLGEDEEGGEEEEEEGNG